MSDSFSHAASLQLKLNGGYLSGRGERLIDSTKDGGIAQTGQNSNLVSDDLKGTVTDNLNDFSPLQQNLQPNLQTAEPSPVVIRKLPNGAIVTEDTSNPQPYRVTTWPDGNRLVEHYLDSIYVMHQPDGTRVTTFADGSSVRTFPSGKKVITKV